MSDKKRRTRKNGDAIQHEPRPARLRRSPYYEAEQKYGIEPTGPVDTRRVEGGIFNWGADMTWQNNALEITGLERLVDWHLADDAVISLPALRKIRERGVKK